MASVHASRTRARIMTLRCDPDLIAEQARRSHSAAEYLADVASAAGPDTAMAARELSAALYELFDLVRRRPPNGAVELVLRALSPTRGAAVQVDATLPGDPELVATYVGWAAPITDGRDPLIAPDPGDGLRELATLHGVEVGAAPVSDGVRLTLRVPLAAADPAEHEEASDGG